MGPFTVPNSTVPHIPTCLQNEKAAYYGAAHKECGGPVTDVSSGSTSRMPSGDEVVPMQWSMNDIRALEEVSVAYNIKGCINLTEADGQMPLFCAQTNRPYLGLTHTDKLRDALEKKTIDNIFVGMQKTDDPLHEPEFVKLLEQSKQDRSKEVDKDSAKPKSKAKGSAKAVPAPKAKQKVTPKAKASNEDIHKRLAALDDGSGGEVSGGGGDSDRGSDVS